jgi:hypothetical protein
VNPTQVVDATLTAFPATMPECRASGIVDRATGTPLGADTVEEHPGEVPDAPAAATVNLFQGRTVSSDHLVHLFLRSRATPDDVAVVGCGREANVGTLMAQARLVVREHAGA